MIDDLIERVEKGEGEDRELDAAISVHLHPWLADLPRSHVGGWVHPAHGLIASPDYFTTSLDAVVALIEEKLPGRGHGYATGWDAEGNCGGFISPERTVNLTKAVMRRASSPARALLSAFLRAFKEQSHDR